MGFFSFLRKEKVEVEEKTSSSYTKQITNLIEGVNLVNNYRDILIKNLSADYKNTTIISQISALIPSLKKQIGDIRDLSSKKLKTLSDMDLRGADKDLIDKKNFLIIFVNQIDKLKINLEEFEAIVNRGIDKIDIKDLFEFEDKLKLNNINMNNIPNF